MIISIIETPWMKTLIGLSIKHDPAQTYGDEIRTTLGPVWEAVRRDQIATMGINHVFYGEQDEVFCGLEFKGEPSAVPGLELRRIELARYAYYRHVGPYEQIPAAYAILKSELESLGLRPVLPGLEIYGHWNEDPQKLVTEIIQNIHEAKIGK